MSTAMVFTNLFDQNSIFIQRPENFREQTTTTGYIGVSMYNVDINQYLHLDYTA